MIKDLVKHSKRVWIILSAALVAVGAIIALARAVVRTDALDVKIDTVKTEAKTAVDTVKASTDDAVKAVRAEVDMLKMRERDISARVHKLDVKLDFVLERLGVPIPDHLRASPDSEQSP